ncbi:hypothetical protein E3E11_06285 [Oecophyllibacter saccharovorans]|uniref:2OG-Fe dioxygenase family protein n=1 Tax=Oecophyllibacter saccharovorans TaxID=2558360 RepID=UPI00114141A7|nr:2OG-Fe dioxygenase family protein [Oecophyllibacter saccharovorans]QDH15518.1 hypothetical protein E3E11_06285 [Oecophyllibacter saccharovorans]
MSPAPVPADLLTPLQKEGFAFVPAKLNRKFLEGFGLKDWAGFAESWNHLGLDRYMADGGHYRRRRYATYSIPCLPKTGPDDRAPARPVIQPKPPQPHYQSRDYNPLNGDIERWFAPILPEISAHPALQATLQAAGALATELTPPERRPASWHAEVHQFRIEADTEGHGKPTPEGLHRDGVDFVFVLMVKRHNIREGETSITALDRETLLGSFTLTEPLDAALVNDHRVFHGVTPVEALAVGQPAYRDVLVVTLRHE